MVLQEDAESGSCQVLRSGLEGYARSRLGWWESCQAGGTRRLQEPTPVTQKVGVWSLGAHAFRRREPARRCRAESTESCATGGSSYKVRTPCCETREIGHAAELKSSNTRYDALWILFLRRIPRNILKDTDDTHWYDG